MLEEKWGVSAAAPMVMGGMPMMAAAVEEVEEQTEFDVILKEIVLRRLMSSRNFVP